jgi:hypothetical protein
MNLTKKEKEKEVLTKHTLIEIEIHYIMCKEGITSTNIPEIIIIIMKLTY